MGLTFSSICDAADKDESLKYGWAHYNPEWQMMSHILGTPFNPTCFQSTSRNLPYIEFHEKKRVKNPTVFLSIIGGKRGTILVISKKSDPVNPTFIPLLGATI